MKILLVSTAALLVGHFAFGGCERPENLVQNCGLDVDVSGWTIHGDAGGTATHVAEDGSSEAGCLEVASRLCAGCGPFGLDSHVATVSQCVSIASGVSYGVGVDLRVAAGTPDECELSFDGPCVGAVGGMSLLFVPDPAWHQASPSFTFATSAQEVLLQVECTAAAQFTVRVDDFFLGAGLVPVALQRFFVE